MCVGGVNSCVYSEWGTCHARRSGISHRRPCSGDATNIAGRDGPVRALRPNNRSLKISDPPKRDLDAEADEALEIARSLPSGPEKAEALKKAGLLRKAADGKGIVFTKRGRPPK